MVVSSVVPAANPQSTMSALAGASKPVGLTLPDINGTDGPDEALAHIRYGDWASLGTIFTVDGKADLAALPSAPTDTLNQIFKTYRETKYDLDIAYKRALATATDATEQAIHKDYAAKFKALDTSLDTALTGYAHEDGSASFAVSATARALIQLKQKFGLTEVTPYDRISYADLSDDISDKLGSHLGNLLTSKESNQYVRLVEKTIATAVLTEVFERLGRTVTANLIEDVAGGSGDGDGGGIGDLLSFSVVDAISKFTDNFDDKVWDFSKSGLNKLTIRLLASAAEDLGLGQFGKWAAEHAGRSISDAIIQTIESYNDPLASTISFNELIKPLSELDNIRELANNFVSYSLTQTTLSIITHQLNDVFDFIEDFVKIDKEGEEIFAQAASVVGSVIGNQIPVIGSIVVSKIGYVFGSLLYEAINKATGGWLKDAFDADPLFFSYIAFDPISNHLTVYAEDGKRDGSDDYPTIVRTVREMTSIHLNFVNGIIDEVGGRIDLRNFKVYGPSAIPNLLDHTYYGYRHGESPHDVGFDDYQVVFGRDVSGNFIHDDDHLDRLIRIGVERELSKLEFRGGDLAKYQAIKEWRADKALLGQGKSLPALRANLEIAEDYRTYLDNQEVINMMMLTAPHTAFALGWVATLAQAQALGLDRAYTTLADGAVGTERDDRILAGQGDDILHGLGGNDDIRGYSGDDTIYGGAGTDTIDAGSGDDFVTGDDGDDVISGQDGRDSLFGSEGNDRIDGGAGADQLGGDGGNDTIMGGTGDDVIYGDAAGQAGDDTLFGGDGADQIRGGGGRDVIHGDGGNDLIHGDDGDDDLQGNDDDDILQGGAGNDRADGGAGDDDIRGDTGNDTLAGGSGHDRLTGGTGDDRLAGGADDDALNGNDGDDIVSGDSGQDQAFGGAGKDQLSGAQGDDLLVGGDGNDILSGGDGDDILEGDRQPGSDPGESAQEAVIDAFKDALGARNFGLIYQGPSYTTAGLAAAPHDLLIINPARTNLDTSRPGGERLWTAAEVDTIGADGKQLYAYLNVAKINGFTGMWQADWSVDGTAGATLAAGAPAWLGAVDTGYPNTRLVDFGADGWLDQLVARARVIIDQGFDGMLLDDVLEYYNRFAGSASEIQAAARDMRDLVIALSEAARTYHAQVHAGEPDREPFRILVNGAPYIISDARAGASGSYTGADARYFTAIDGILTENYLTSNRAAIDKVLSEFASRDLAVLALEGMAQSDAERIALMKDAIGLGLMPFVTSSADYARLDPPMTIGFGDHPAPGIDILYGGAGDDRLSGGGGLDYLRGGAGADTYLAGRGQGVDRIDEAGGDTAVAGQLPVFDRLVLNGIDTLEQMRLARISMSGDTAPDSLAIDLGEGDRVEIFHQLDGSDPVRRVERLMLGDGRDFILRQDRATGDAGDIVQGSQGRDVISGRGGDDYISGGDGNDVLAGDAGDDVLAGGAGVDLLRGGAGADTYIVGRGDGLDRISEIGGDRLVTGGPLILDRLILDGTLSLAAVDIRRIVAAGETAAYSLEFAIGGGDVIQVIGHFAPSATGRLERLTLADGRTYVLRADLSADARADLITGTAAADTINGRAGDDYIAGAEGMDRLAGDAGDDILRGDGGDDRLTGGAGADLLNGGTGNDTADYAGATAGVTVDLVTGGTRGDAAGDVFVSIERVHATIFADTLAGGVDAEDLHGLGGNDILIGRAGADRLDGGTGIDTASYAGSLRAVTVDLLTGRGKDGDAEGDILLSIENLDGSNGNGDSLVGNSSANRLRGLGGNDVLTGGAGADVLDGGAGSDRARYAGSNAAVSIDLASGDVSGGHAAGDRLISVENLEGSAYGDNLRGNNGSNELFGGAGDDLLNGRAGADRLDGGSGRDTATYASSKNAVVLDLVTGRGTGGDAEGDQLTSIEILVGSSSADRLSGRENAEDLRGGAGDDVLRGRGGADLLDGGTGRDIADYGDSAAGVAVDLQAGRGSSGDAAGDRLSSIEVVVGSGREDKLLGSANADSLYGGRGNDMLAGRAGSDLLDGGAGVDTASYAGSSAAVQLDLMAGRGRGGDAEGDRLVAIENLIGSAQGDMLVGSNAANRLDGGNGNDTLIGRGGADILVGGAGSDLVSYADSASRVTVDLATGSGSGGDAAGDSLSSVERLLGSAFDDRLWGAIGDDILSGGNGNDMLTGRGGKDQLVGGAGADRFVYASIADSRAGTGTRDIIRDFSRAEGDLIVLTSIDADTLRAGDQAFSFIGSRGFDGTAGALRTLAMSEKQALVQIDTNGDRISDFEIIVAGTGVLTGSDFLL
ncbi:hypothetical protein [Tistrella mobilis]|uniref:hypothetical protein n=1 Tax=Tistrella mobilis TaxID=171437 RepID=UPI0035592D37